VPGDTASVRHLLGGVAVGAALLVVFGALLASADRAFARALREATPDVARHGSCRRSCCSRSGPPPCCSLPVACSPRAPANHGRAARCRPDWVPALVMLDSLFGWFIVVHLARLFGDDRYVLGPGGPDYAEYARARFVQLLVVTALTLVVIAVVAQCPDFCIFPSGKNPQAAATYRQLWGTIGVGGTRLAGRAVADVADVR
jgi:hypothetical protein